ncbi:MAG: hypothetical protein R3Y50_09450 [Rikenellaceae bacterium]
MLARMREPLFLVFILLSLAVWYFNKLNSTFTVDQTIPVKIKGVENPVQIGRRSYFDVSCKISAKGYDLMILRLFPMAKMVEISLDESLLTAAYSKENPSIESESIYSKIGNKIRGISVLEINDKLIKLPEEKNIKKMVEVIHDISVNSSNGGYMLVGDIMIEPCSVLLSGSKEILANISAVTTEKKELKSRRSGDIRGEVGIKMFDNIIYSTEKVSYIATTDRFTEKEFTLKPKIHNRDTSLNHFDFISIPTNVTVMLNCAQDVASYIDESDFDIFAYYSRENQLGKNIYEVKIDNLPEGVTLQSVQPQFITILKMEKE